MNLKSVTKHLLAISFLLSVVLGFLGTLFLGALYGFQVHLLYEIQYNTGREEVLVNNQVHTLVWTEGFFAI